MRKTLFLTLLLLVSCQLFAASESNTVKASSSKIRWIGRTLEASGGAVSFNWSGTSFTFDFIGTSAQIIASDTGKNYFDVFADGVLHKTISTSGKDSTICLYEGEDAHHTILVRRRTEGSLGVTTLHAVILPEGAKLLKPAPPKKRFIEIIGDSFTCGYGTESFHGSDPFTAETENCGKAYGVLISEYFDADYQLICHSGRGVVRNYGDKYLISEKGTMREMYSYALDDDPSTAGGSSNKSPRPDIVLIFLGENDFSTGQEPTREAFTEAYRQIIAQVRKAHGDVPILCIAPFSSKNLIDYIYEVADSEDDNVHYMAQYPKIYSRTTDLGASQHPNYLGQQKISLNLLPYISTITGWSVRL